MNVANFIEEFTRLIIRWTSNPSPRNEEPAMSPLSSDVLLSTMQQVVNATLNVNVTITNESSIKTPASAIVVNTPHAPVVHKIVYDQSNDSIIQTSFDSLSSKFAKNDSTNNSPNQSVKQEDKEKPEAEMETGTLSALTSETKFISRSSPAVYISTMGRSDTFTRDKTTANEDEAFDDTEYRKIENDIVDIPERTLDGTLLQKLDLLRGNALDLVSLIDDLQKKKQKNVRPIRRLSSAAGFPGLPRTNAMMRTIPPPKMRRSVSGISPGTPTSSRLDTEKQQSLKRAKSTSTTSLNVPGTAKLSIPVRSSGMYGNAAEKSPSTDRPAKNPKYAHVQSTIPRASSAGKKKS